MLGRKAKIIHILAKEKENIDNIVEWKEGEKGKIEFTLKNISRAFKMDEITIKEKICYRCGIVYEEDFERCPKCGKELDEADIENS